MARYSPEHKQATRQRIIDTAGRRLKQDGIDGAGIAVLMADAGLTNGAFYAHFASKDDLVAAVVADQLRTQRDALAALPPGQAGARELRARVPVHRAPRPARQGCPSAALLDEIGRCDDAVRSAYAEGLAAIIDTVAVHLSPRNPEGARTRTQSLITLMIGTMQLARSLPDDTLSAEVLDRGLDTALRMLR